MNISPAVTVPVDAFKEPTMKGLTKPLSVPIELITAIPPAAADPASIFGGMAQKTGIMANMPAVAMENKATDRNTFTDQMVESNAKLPTRPAIAQCHLRSSVLSDLAEIAIIPTTATL